MNLLGHLVELLFPRKCPVCGRRLSGKEIICLYCMSRLPHTDFHLTEENVLMRRFYGSFKIERVAAYFFYDKYSPYHQIVWDFKYRNHRKMALEMGRYMAVHVKKEGDFFRGIDAILPVPLSPQRLWKRGYNQSELLARGIASVTSVPVVTDALIRVRDNPSQTKQGEEKNRWRNVENLFEVTEKAGLLHGKHLLLVDDVITTGATMSACIRVLQASVLECKISIMALAVTQ